MTIIEDEATTDEAEIDYDPIRDMTPQGAIQQDIWDLCQERADWAERDDPNGVRPWLNARLACLEQAQRDLDELREIKKALAVLKGVL